MQFKLTIKFTDRNVSLDRQNLKSSYITLLTFHITGEWEEKDGFDATY